MSKLPFLFAHLAVAAILWANPAPAANKPPLPSGPQTDGAFRKVILDTDRQIDGKWVDSLKDPMELAVAPDGRVFYAQRDGTIKVWKPETKTTIVIARIPVFEGLEEGMLGITLDPTGSSPSISTPTNASGRWSGSATT
jgi:cytochrome c